MTKDLETAIMTAAKDFGNKVMIAVRKAHKEPAQPWVRKGRTAQINIKCTPEIRARLCDCGCRASPTLSKAATARGGSTSDGKRCSLMEIRRNSRNRL